MKKSELKFWINTATKTLNKEKDRNSYSYALGVLQSTIIGMCVTEQIDSKDIAEFTEALEKHYQTKSEK